MLLLFDLYIQYQAVRETGGVLSLIEFLQYLMRYSVHCNF